MKLIIATPSPFARKVRVILREKAIHCEEIIDVPWNKDTITKGLNPLGKIPILIKDGIEPIFDSKNIEADSNFLNGLILINSFSSVMPALIAKGFPERVPA